MFLNFYSYKIHFVAYFFCNLFLLKYGGGSGVVTKSCATLVTSWSIACQAPLSMGFSRQVGCHFLLHYWSIVELQCCVNYCCTAKWLCYTHTHTHIVFHILFHYGLSQDIGYHSLCYAAGPCCLSIPWITVCIC